jgi:hypothetical protein
VIWPEVDRYLANFTGTRIVSAFGGVVLGSLYFSKILRCYSNGIAGCEARLWSNLFYGLPAFVVLSCGLLISIGLLIVGFYPRPVAAE